MKLRHITIFAFMAFMLFMFASSEQAKAQFEPLPELQAMSAEEFAAQTEIVSKTFENDDYLSLEFSVQKDWMETPFEGLKNSHRTGRLYGVVAEYIGPVVNDIAPYFRVNVEEIEREISAKNWFLNYVLYNGFTLKGFEFDDKEESFEGFYISRLGMDSFVVRVAGRKVGPRMILAEYGVPSYGYSKYGDSQTWVIKSAKIKGRDTQPIEERKYFAYLDSLTFGYPESWYTDKEVVYAQNKMSVNLFNAERGRVPYGTITARVISARAVNSLDDFTVYETDIKAELKEVKDAIAKEYTIKPIIENKVYNLPPTVKFQSTDIYPLEPIQSEYVRYEKGMVTDELWFSLVVHGYKYYIITMITPARSRDSMNWALNAEAYKILMESLIVERDESSVEFINEFKEKQKESLE